MRTKLCRKPRTIQYMWTYVLTGSLIFIFILFCLVLSQSQKITSINFHKSEAPNLTQSKWFNTRTSQAYKQNGGKLANLVSGLKHFDLDKFLITKQKHEQFDRDMSLFIEKEFEHFQRSKETNQTLQEEESRLMFKVMGNFVKTGIDEDQLTEKIREFIVLASNTPRDLFLNLHQYSWLIDSWGCMEDKFLVTIVHSAPNNFQQRRTIRQTFGAIKEIDALSLKVVFMLGASSNKTLMESVQNESKLFDDIVQGNFEDSYRNLTYKHIMGYHWIDTHCKNVKYILKIDDDTMVNMFRIINFLKRKSFKNLFHCYRIESLSIPFRRPEARVFVSHDVYPFYRWPKSCLGFGYIFSSDMTPKILKASADSKFINTDDVFVTGILTLKAGINVTEIDISEVVLSATSDNRDMSCNCINNLMFVNDRSGGKTYTLLQYWDTFNQCQNFKRLRHKNDNDHGRYVDLKTDK